MARRAKGEGSVYREKSTGRWIAAVDLGYRNGRRHRVRRVATTQGEALALRDQLLQDHGLGIAVDAERQTVAQFLDGWLQDVVRPRRRPKTYATYSDAVRLRIAPALGRVQLRRLTGQQIQRMLRDLERDGRLSPSTVHQTYRVLRTALEKAREWKLLRDNPAEFVEPPPIPRRERQTFSVEEARTFLASLADDRLGAAFLLALSTSLRRGELLGLRWRDVDLDEATLRVRSQLQLVEGTLRLVEVKTSGSEGTLALAPMVVEALREQSVRQKRERLRAGELWHQPIPTLVFTTRTGTPIAPANLGRAFKLRLAAAGLPEMRLHDLRHTGATLLAREHIPPRDVMHALRHASIGTTMNLYAHALPEGQREVAATWERLLGAPSTTAEPQAHR